MVRIPDVFVPTVNFQPTGQPEAQAQRVAPFQDPTGQMIAQMGQGISALGEGISRVENQVDNARTKEAESLLADFAVESLTKYKSLAGKAAVDQYDAMRSGLQKRRTEAEKLLQNDTQRSMFRMAADRRMRSYQSAFESHYLDQVKVWDGAQNQARIQQFANEAMLASDAAFEAAANPENPYQLAKGGMERAIQDQASLLQLPVDSDPASPYQQYRIKQLQGLHESILGSFLDNNQPAKAAQYLKQVEEQQELSAPALIKYRNAIADKTQSDEAFRLFQAWRAQNYDAGQMAQELDGMLQKNEVSQQVYDKLNPRIEAFERDSYRKEQRDIKAVRQEVTNAFRKLQMQGGTDPLIWDDLPQQLRERATALGQDIELRQKVNSGMMYVDTSEGLQAYRTLRTDPSSLIDKDWSELENAFRFQMSDETLDKVAKIHAAVNRQRAVELEQAAAKQQKDNELKTTWANQRIDIAVDQVYPDIKIALMSENERAVARAAKDLMKTELREAAAQAKTQAEFEAFLQDQQANILRGKVDGSEVRVSPGGLRVMQDAGIELDMTEFSYSSVDENGNPVQRAIGDRAAPVMNPNTMQPIMVPALNKGKQKLSLYDVVKQFNDKQPDAGMKVQTEVSLQHPSSQEGIFRYLFDKRKLARELLANPDLLNRWNSEYGQQNVVAMFGGDIQMFANSQVTLDRVFKMREMIEQGRTSSEVASPWVRLLLGKPAEILYNIRSTQK